MLFWSEIIFKGTSGLMYSSAWCGFGLLCLLLEQEFHVCCERVCLHHLTGLTQARYLAPLHTPSLNLERNFKAGRTQDDKFWFPTFYFGTNCFDMLQQCAIGWNTWTCNTLNPRVACNLSAKISLLQPWYLFGSCHQTNLLKGQVKSWNSVSTSVSTLFHIFYCHLQYGKALQDVINQMFYPVFGWPNTKLGA